MENLRKYHKKLEDEELVYVTQKLDGESHKSVYHDGRLYIGSRGQWKREYPTKPVAEDIIPKIIERGKVQGLSDELIDANVTRTLDRINSWNPSQSKWWSVVDRYNIRNFCENNPGLMLYGEIFAHSHNRIVYTLDKGPIRYAAFDILDTKSQKFLDYDDFLRLCGQYNVPTVPIICKTEYSFNKILELAETPNLLGPGISEGVVVRPFKERIEPHIGRCVFKLHSSAFLQL